MKNHRLTLLLIFLSLQVVSLNSSAAQPASLVIPEALGVVSVDSTKYSKPLFSSFDTTLKLQPGQHKIVLEYEVLFEIGADDHEIFKSEPFQIAFSAVAGKQYSIKVPAFKEADLGKARVYAKKPVIALIDRATRQVVAAEITYREFDGTFSQRYNISAEPAKAEKAPAMTAAMFGAQASRSATAPKTEQATSRDMPLKMLDYWWQQASAQERKQFIETR